jgi:hypothetical protein
MWKMRYLVWGAALICTLAVVHHAQSQTPRTYTCTWNHDGVGVEAFVVLVDGAAAPTTVTCNGAGPTRLCSTPLTMAASVPHTIIVKAVGAFGEAASDPFVAAPPSKPAGVLVK